MRTKNEKRTFKNKIKVETYTVGLHFSFSSQKRNRQKKCTDRKHLETVPLKRGHVNKPLHFYVQFCMHPQVYLAVWYGANLLQSKPWAEDGYWLCCLQKTTITFTPVLAACKQRLHDIFWGECQLRTEIFILFTAGFMQFFESARKSLNFKSPLSS